MDQRKQLPFLPDVILKVKQLQELTAEEELVYLIYIEDMNEEDAMKFVNSWYADAKPTDLKN